MTKKSFFLLLATVLLCSPTQALAASASLSLQAGPALRSFTATTDKRVFNDMLPGGIATRIMVFTKREFMFSGAIDANLSLASLTMVFLSLSARGNYFFYGGNSVSVKDSRTNTILTLSPPLSLGIYAGIGTSTFNFSSYRRVLPLGAAKPVDAKDNARGNVFFYEGGMLMRYELLKNFLIGLEGGMALGIADPSYPSVSAFGGALTLDLPL